MFTWSSDSLSNAAIPTILVSSKCDNNRKAWQIDQRMIERTCSTIGGIESFQTSSSSPETQKRCVSIVLRKVLSARDGESSILSYISKSLHYHFIQISLHICSFQNPQPKTRHAWLLERGTAIFIDYCWLSNRSFETPFSFYATSRID